MKGLDHSDTDPELEDELRATLHRRAADVRPDPPRWQDLVRRSEAVVVSLHTGRPRDGDAQPRAAHRSGDWRWLRPALAAAACLAVVMAAGIVVGRSTGSSGGSSHTAEQPGPHDGTADGIPLDETIPVAGDSDFSVGTAPSLIPGLPDEGQLQARIDEAGGLPQDLRWMSTPEDAGLQYLQETVGLAEGSDVSLWWDQPLPVEEVVTSEARIEITTMWWSVRFGPAPGPGEDRPIATMGRVFLRNLTSPADTESPDAWIVVGADTQGLDLANVTRDEDELHFAVTAFQGADAEVDPSDWPVEVKVNGELVNDRPLSPYQPVEFDYPVLSSEPATVTVQQLGLDSRLSIVATTVLPGDERTADGVDTEPVVPHLDVGASNGTVVFDGCAPDVGLAITMDLPPGLSDGIPGQPGVCTFSFDDPRDTTEGLTVGWGEPPFEVPTELQGPACFRWAALDDGGFVAVRTDPFPIYAIGSGMTEADFEQAVTSSVLSGSSDWTADEGC